MNIKQTIGILSFSLLIVAGNCFGMDIRSGNLEIYNDSPNPIIVDIQDDRGHDLHHFEIPAKQFINQKLVFPIKFTEMGYTIRVFAKPENHDRNLRLLSKFLITNVTKNNNVIVDIIMRGNVSHMSPSKAASKGNMSRGGLNLDNNITASNIHLLQR